MRPTEFRERYLNGTLDTFDVVFTYSTVEHSGLGGLYTKFVTFPNFKKLEVAMEMP